MINAMIIALILCGVLFFVATTVGLLRFPDFYTRVHAAGKGDTLSTALILAGLTLYFLQEFSGENLLVAFKLSLIVAFVFIASPTATHAIIDAGYEAGIPFWNKGRSLEADPGGGTGDEAGSDPAAGEPAVEGEESGEGEERS